MRGRGAGSDCDQKPKLPFCNGSKLPSRNVSRGPEKSCTPIRAGGNQATLSPWACIGPWVPVRLCNQATPPHGVALLHAHIKLPRHLDTCQATLSLGPGSQNLLHSHAHIKLPSRFCNSIKLGFRLLQIKLPSRNGSGEAARSRCGCAKVAKSLPSWLPSLCQVVPNDQATLPQSSMFRNRKIPLTRNFIF